MYRRNIRATASRTAPPVVTATQRLQQHVANDPKKMATKVSFDRCGSRSASSMLRQITIRDTELVLQLEPVLVSSLSNILFDGKLSLVSVWLSLVNIGCHRQMQGMYSFADWPGQYQQNVSFLWVHQICLTTL